MIDQMVKTKRLTGSQRDKIAVKIIDTGIVAAVSLLFNQAFSGHPFDLRLAILGGCLLGLSYSSAIWLMKKGGGR
jgi:hypothetical protein